MRCEKRRAFSPLRFVWRSTIVIYILLIDRLPLRSNSLFEKHCICFCIRCINFNHFVEIKENVVNDLFWFFSFDFSPRFFFSFRNFPVFFFHLGEGEFFFFFAYGRDS